MVRVTWACFLFIFFISVSFVSAQDEDLRTVVDYKVDKMKKELGLTEAQADAVRPIVKDFMVKRQAVLDEAAGQGIVDHAALKSTLMGLKEIEYKKLGNILNPDQLKEWVNRENLTASLNSDGTEVPVSDDESTELTPGGAGANFKF